MSQQAGNVLDDPALLSSRQNSAYPPQRAAQIPGVPQLVTMRAQLGARDSPHLMNQIYGPAFTSHVALNNTIQASPLNATQPLQTVLPNGTGLTVFMPQTPQQVMPGSLKHMTRSQARSAADPNSPSSSNHPLSPGPVPPSPSRPPRVKSDLIPEKTVRSPRKRGGRAARR